MDELMFDGNAVAGLGGGRRFESVRGLALLARKTTTRSPNHEPSDATPSPSGPEVTPCSVVKTATDRA